LPFWSFLRNIRVFLAQNELKRWKEHWVPVAKSSSKKPSRSQPVKTKKAVTSKGKKPVKAVAKKAARPAKAKAAVRKPIKKARPAPAKKLTARPAAKAAVVAKPVKKNKTQANTRSVAPPAMKAVAKSKSAKPTHAVQVKPEPFQMQITPAVATNLKPRKNQIGLGVRELEHFADLLLAKRRELVGDMSSMEREALRSGSASNLSTLPMHMADMGTDNYEQEFTLGLVEKDRNLLREINHALAKIQNGTYGICEGTGIAISKFRLEAQPWARFSIEYARQKEKNGMGVRTF
jgi:DnaK suppressor protein